MKIVVCVKQVPATNSVKIDPQTNNLVRSGVEGEMNQFDKNAIEAALQLKARAGGSVTLLTMGPPDYATTLRDGLAMGADDAILLSSRQFAGADTLATGYVLAAALRKIGQVDLVLFGRQATDADTGQVGPIVATKLGWPQITFVNQLQLADDQHLTGTRLLEDREETVTAQFPVVVTVRQELNQPRYETPVNIMGSFDKPLVTWTEADLDLDPQQLGQAGSPTIVKRVFAPEKVSKKTTDLGQNADSAVTELLTALKSQSLV